MFLRSPYLKGKIMKTLQETLQYQNSQLPLRIQRAQGCSLKEAKKLFQDMKAWLWLCARHRFLLKRNPKKFLFFRDLRMLDRFQPIDVAWHEFILMTREYTEFCTEYLGGYIHHTPALIRPRTFQRVNPPPGERYFEVYFEFIYDQLGEKTLKRWMYDLSKISMTKGKTL